MLLAKRGLWRERKIIAKKKTHDIYTQMNNKVRKVLGKASGCRLSVTSAELRVSLDGPVSNATILDPTSLLNGGTARRATGRSGETRVDDTFWIKTEAQL